MDRDKLRALLNEIEIDNCVVEEIKKFISKYPFLVIFLVFIIGYLLGKRR